MQDALKTPGGLLLTLSKAVVLCNYSFMLFDVGVLGRFSYSIVGYLLAHLSRRL